MQSLLPRQLHILALFTLSVSVVLMTPGSRLAAQARPAPQRAVLWINHLDLVPGDVDVEPSFNSTSSGVGGGLSGLIITSTTLGENSLSGGNKVVEKGVQVPPGFAIVGVRVCYELSDGGATGSFISQIRLAQLQDPPSTALVLLDDGTDLTSAGPVCLDSAGPFGGTPIDPAAGAVRLNLRVNFNDTSHKIVLRGLALHLVRLPGR